MRTDELVRAVTRPAVRAGLIVEKMLVATVVKEASERPGALPFLSHAMWETWRRRRGNGLLLAGYEAAGGLAGAVAQSADRVYDELDERQRRVMRTVLLRLIALGEGTEDTRRRVGRAELGSDPGVVEVVDRLAAARLLTLGEGTVEIAHEALIRGWPRLCEWLTEDREALRAHRRLGEAANEWERNGRDAAYLYRGGALAAWQAAGLDTVNETERAFLAASVALHDRERLARRRRVRRSFVAMGVTTVVVSVLAALAVFQADRVADERDLALSRQLAASARGQLSVDPELALLLAVEAVEVAPTEQADAVLRQAVVDHRALATLPTGHGKALGVAISPDGRRIVTTGDDSAVRIWGQRNGAWRVEKVLSAQGIWSTSPVFSKDGRYLAATLGTGENGEIRDGAVRVWDMDRDGEPVVLDGCGGYDDLIFRELVFSPDGRRLVSGDFKGNLLVWNPKGGGEPTALAKHGGRVTELAVSPDGSTLASSGEDGVIRLTDLSGYTDPTLLRGHRGPVRDVAFSPDGRYFASVGDDGTLRLWSAARVDATVMPGVALSSDGRTLAGGGEDGTVRVWNTEGGNPVTLRGHIGAVAGVAFAPDGQRLFTAGSDGTVRVWRLGVNAEPVVYDGYRSPVMAVAYSPAGDTLLTTHEDGTVQAQPCDVCGSLAQTLELAKNRATRQLTAEERATFAVP